jgi:RNA polymerase sigma-70 factor (ECF subfamily)
MSDPDWNELLTTARQGGVDALHQLFALHEKDLFRLLYRMLGHRADAEDLLQECWLRGQRAVGSFQGDAVSMRAWWFGIASHLALDCLRVRKRWREEAQLIAEQETDSSPVALERLAATVSEPDFRYEVKEHIAFCFTCIGRTLEPTEQAALLLCEVFDFSNVEAARILQLSEPVFRHRLSSARQSMTQSFQGLCQLINKTGRCYQCVTLREIVPEGSRGELVTRIDPATPFHGDISDALLQGRIAIVKAADLEHGTSAKLHTAFFRSLTAREENREN